MAEKSQEKLSIFLSHSHKDVEKIRRIRDVLEILECEPLIFYLKSMDDNDQLSELLKAEIRARNVFLYCRSKNAEESRWVREEVEYIKSLPGKRFYEVDIDQDFSVGMVGFLQQIINIVKSNQLFFSCSRKDQETADKVAAFLADNGYKNVLRKEEMTAGSFLQQIETAIRKAAENGVFLLFCNKYDAHNKLVWQEYELAKSMNAVILPVFIGGVEESLPEEIKYSNGCIISENVTEEDCMNILTAIRSITEK